MSVDHEQIALCGWETGQSRMRDVSERYSLSLVNHQEESIMEGPLRGCLAGAGAWKLGGGCLSTIVIFIILYLLLGHVKC
jgi:hypothetical protein